MGLQRAFDRAAGRKFMDKDKGAASTGPVANGVAGVSAARMVAGVELLQAFLRHGGVDLGGGEAGVAKQHL